MYARTAPTVRKTAAAAATSSSSADVEWSTDISGIVPSASVMGGGRSVSKADETGIPEPVIRRKAAAADGESRSRLVTFVLVVAALIAVAALVIAIVAFTRSSDETTTTTTTTTLAGATTAPAATVASALFAGAAAAAAAVRPAVSPLVLGNVGMPDVTLDFVCNQRITVNRCVAVFSYTNTAGEQTTALAGTASNRVEPGPADRGQLEVFAPGVNFGAASFEWNCQAHPRAVWTLRTGPAGSASVAEAPAAQVDCPPIPL